MLYPSTNYQANGKLLFTGEYFVLDGAVALALPTQLGQSLRVGIVDDGQQLLTWKAHYQTGETWFTATFSLPDGTLKPPVAFEAERLQQVLLATRKLNPDFLNKRASYQVTTQLQFPNDWGLGSSSTLIANVAKWAGVDAFALLHLTFGGSGYDIACAVTDQPITYQIVDSKPTWQTVDFAPPFAQQLYFVHLGKKQNSREGIARYRTIAKQSGSIISEINGITQQMIGATSLDVFRESMEQHEEIIATALQLPKVRNLFFNDLAGSVKSLGAWGGDMVLVATEMPETELKAYFKQRNFNTLVPYNQLILHQPIKNSNLQ